MWQKPFLATVATLSAEMQMGNATPRQVGNNADDDNDDVVVEGGKDDPEADEDGSHGGQRGGKRRGKNWSQDRQSALLASLFSVMDCINIDNDNENVL